MTERGFAARWHLANQLARVPTMEYDDGRKMILQMFKSRGYELPAVAVPTICYQVIDFLANQPGVLRRLAETVSLADRSPLAENFENTVRHQLPSDFFGLDDRLEFIAEISKVASVDHLGMYYVRA